ncbi:RHS repeat domain-containing protein [Prevotella disiens]|nr:RHS repeat-associated core domain-containing protein [Prevotella disiens]
MYAQNYNPLNLSSIHKAMCVEEIGETYDPLFQLDNVRDINYRTEETPTDSTNINNGHKYAYDLNGNLVYINTSRVKIDGKEDEKATEQKHKWDEENRLLAADENYSIKREQSQICLSYAERENNRPKVNGFVSNYWYDADGERTVKTSGENEAIYVNYRASRVQCQVCLSIAEAQPIITESNSEFSGGNTGTARFSLYVSPYLVAGQGGKYTKHIYVGSQRIVSKLGDLASYGADPRRIPYAGNEADGLTVDYKAKYNRQLQSIKDNYKAFDQPYNGKDNDDYVNGQGFCCNDGTPEATQARAMARTRAANGNFKPNDDYEKMQFYYHPDHLGSSSYITNLDGEVSQHIEYVPFGEVFLEERNNTWNTPYLFNAKEFDEETGMYYYGARYYEPRLSLWMSVDPLTEKSPNVSAYVYCFGNPLKYIDPIGLDSVYWGQDGTKLGTFGSNTTETKNYVIKTSQSTDVIYKDSNPTQKGKSNPISQKEYDKTVEEIKKGDFSSKNIVYIGKTERIKAMLESIKDDGTGGTSDQNNREYSGNFNKSGTGVVDEKTGNVQDPWKGNVSSEGTSSYHSHPSGTSQKNDQTASWQQPPSKQDISTAKRTEYVIGMGSKLIYRYDKSGVNAVFPISIFK